MIQNTLMRIAIIGLAVLFSVGTHAQTSFSTLEERMTAREFRDAGLHKLSDEELAALNRWIRLRSLAEGEVPEGFAPDESVDPSEDRRGFAGQGDRDDRPIRSRIVGKFNGWSGNDQFELENGMVWEQTDGRRFSIRQIENPEVEVSRGAFGTWYLRVEGHNTRTRVKRIR